MGKIIFLDWKCHLIKIDQNAYYSCCKHAHSIWFFIDCVGLYELNPLHTNYHTRKKGYLDKILKAMEKYQFRLKRSPEGELMDT